MRPFFTDAGRTIRSFITNPFVWAGVGGLFLLGLILYIVVDSFLMPQFTRHDDYVEVPDVRNYSVVDAERQLASLDLQSEQVMERLSPEARSEERKSTRLNSSHVAISYAVFCLKKKKVMRYDYAM